MNKALQKRRFVYYKLAIGGGMLMLATLVLSVIFIVQAQKLLAYDMPGLGAFVEIGLYCFPIFIVGVILLAIGVTRLRYLT